MNKRRMGIRGSDLPHGETVLYFPGSTLSQTRSPGHLISQLLLSISITKTTIKADRSDVGLKQKNGQADRLQNLSFGRGKG